MSSSSDSFVNLKHPSGSSAKILKYGATVIDWTSSSGRQNLWLSEAARLDGSRAVRGGIPLVFPVFGKSSHHPTASLPQHGFARTSIWRVIAQNETSVTFGLSQRDLEPSAKSLWDIPFELVYTVSLDESELRCDFEVHNPGVSSSFECHTLLHTYLRIQNSPSSNNAIGISDIEIDGLSGLRYKDKVEKNDFIEKEPTLRITGPTDRVYEATPLETKVVAKEESIFEIRRDNFKDTVVWNPAKEGAEAMGDFEPKTGWQHMLCVEAGNVADWLQIPPSGFWKGSQVIKSHL